MVRATVTSIFQICLQQNLGGAHISKWSKKFQGVMGVLGKKNFDKKIGASTRENAKTEKTRF